MPRAGVRHVVTSAELGRDGRKYFAVSAIRDEAGDLCAVARATWIQLASDAATPRSP
jgi:acyl-coenzyme A thioesterase PaaI-like protein